MKKILNLLTVVILLTEIAFGRTVTNPSELSEDINVSCIISLEEEFFPVSDTGGKTVITKKETQRNCTETKEALGKCLKWEKIYKEYALPEVQYNTYIEEDHSDSMGSLMAMLGSYDQIEHLWSGFKGYCEEGTKSNFDWADDPAFWGGMGISFAMTASTPGGDGGAGSSAGQQTAKESTKKAAEETWVDSIKNWFEELADNFVSEETLMDVAMDAFEQGSQQTLKEISSQYLQHVGKCLVAATYNTMMAVKGYQDMKGSPDESCDPIDEICGDDPIETTSESEILTMDQVDYEDLVAQAQVDGYVLEDYIEILSTDNGIVTFRMKRTNEMTPQPTSSSAAEEMMKDLQEKMALISLGFNAISTASCLYGVGGYTVQGPMGTDEDKEKTRQGVAMVADFAATFAHQPYGAIAALAVKLVTQIATSYTKMNSCVSEEDAQDAGSRHLKTWSALQMNTCHAQNKRCVQEKDGWQTLFGSSGCSLWGYDYCCYDQILSKVLVVQIKAQLGRDYNHCGDISLRDLNYVSFRQCKSPNDTHPSNGFDGGLDFFELEGTGINKQADLYLQGSFQNNQKCIDLTEFIEHLEAQLDENIPPDVIKEYFEDILE
jgi:hypothetical protein